MHIVPCRFELKTLHISHSSLEDFCFELCHKKNALSRRTCKLDFFEKIVFWNIVSIQNWIFLTFKCISLLWTNPCSDFENTLWPKHTRQPGKKWTCLLVHNFVRCGKCYPSIGFYSLLCKIRLDMAWTLAGIAIALDKLRYRRRQKAYRWPDYGMVLRIDRGDVRWAITNCKTVCADFGRYSFAQHLGEISTRFIRKFWKMHSISQ